MAISPLTLGRWFKKVPKYPYVIVKWSLSNTHILPVSNCILVPNIVPQKMYFSLLEVGQMKSINFLQLLSLLQLPFWSTFFLKPHSIFVSYWSIMSTHKIQNFLWSDKWSVDKIRLFLNSKGKNCESHFSKQSLPLFYISNIFNAPAAVSNCILVPNIVHQFLQKVYFSLLEVDQKKSTNFLQLLSL